MARTVSKGGNPAAGKVVSPEERRRMIAEAAYFRALQRGFSGGGSVEDWLAAEREIDASVRRPSVCATGLPSLSSRPRGTAQLSPAAARPPCGRTLHATVPHRVRPQWLLGVGTRLLRPPRRRRPLALLAIASLSVARSERLMRSRPQTKQPAASAMPSRAPAAGTTPRHTIPSH